LPGHETGLGPFCADAVHISEDMPIRVFHDLAEDGAGVSPPDVATVGRTDSHAGCPIYDIDSDGFIGELIPIWIEAGSTSATHRGGGGQRHRGLSPQVRPEYGLLRRVDKRAMAKGGRVIAKEIDG